MPLRQLEVKVSLLATLRKTMSFCTGSYTAEMGRAVLGTTVNRSGLVEFTSDMVCVGCWDRV